MLPVILTSGPVRTVAVLAESFGSVSSGSSTLVMVKVTVATFESVVPSLTR